MPQPEILDPYRLPRHVIPSRYDLRLEPDLTNASFSGRALIALLVTQPTSEIVLNAAELDVTSVALLGDQGDQREAKIELDEPLERCRLRLDRPIAPGAWQLTLAFAGKLNDKLRGFYRSTYKGADGPPHLLAATQFEATDARRAFPCWDEPDWKAVFAATLVIEPDLTAVSNTRVVGETVERGKKIVQFADSIKMSTYLVAFVVGNLEATEPTFVGRTAVRLWAVPGKTRLAGFGQAIASASLEFFEEYYGIPCPGDKLDLLAIPDFASGAMENLGAITFRESALLADPATATHAELERIADVVAHENAHMWFGDLVTMRWWNGLWLNEAFATFMEMLAVDAWKPEWKRWETFGVSRAAAFAVDGLCTTRPIEYDVRAPKDADAMFDVLTYEKGASVLRMLEQHIGPTAFRDGVRDYLKTYAYGNAETNDLWISLGKVSRHPVPDLMNGWIFQPGYPLITAMLDHGGDLVLTQRRFTYLETSDPKVTEQRWRVPIQIQVTTGSRVETRNILLNSAEDRIELPSDVRQILINAGGHGFYRVRYAPDLLRGLLNGGMKGLTSVDRFNLVSDAWATTVAGLMPIGEYLDMTTQFTGAREKNVWTVLLDSFYFLNRLMSADERPALEAFVRDRLAPLVRELGWQPRAEDDELTRQLRGDLIRALGTIGNDQDVQGRAAELYRAYRATADAVDANIVPSLVAILAHQGDEQRHNEFFERFNKAATPQEERRYLFALAAFRPKALLERTLSRTLSGEIRTQDGPFIVSALLTSVYGRELAWRFLKTNWDLMDRQFPKNGLRRMVGGIVGLATPALEWDVRRFFDERKITLGGKALEQYLEQLHVAVVFRERDGAALSRYLLPFVRGESAPSS